MKNKTTRKSGLTRREFAGAAASVSAAMIVPRRLLGDVGSAAPLQAPSNRAASATNIMCFDLSILLLLNARISRDSNN